MCAKDVGSVSTCGEKENFIKKYKQNMKLNVFTRDNIWLVRAFTLFVVTEIQWKLVYLQRNKEESWGNRSNSKFKFLFENLGQHQGGIYVFTTH